MNRKGRKFTMGRMRENPRYNVISMRVSDEERDLLENLMKTTHKSVSDIMREAMGYFSAHYELDDMS
jgi:predicted DNA-binding protein